MNPFSSEYRYILEAAFDSNFLWALIYCLPSVVGIFFAVLLLMIALEMMIEGRDPTGYYRAQTAIIGSFCMVIFPIVALVLMVWSYAGRPEMEKIEFKRPYLVKIQAIYHNKALENFNDNPLLALRRFQYGGDYSRNTERYNAFQKAINLQIPPGKTVYKKDLAEVFGSSFNQCLRETWGTLPLEPEVRTIGDIQNIIAQEQQVCMQATAQKLINEKVALKYMQPSPPLYQMLTSKKFWQSLAV